MTGGILHVWPVFHHDGTVSVYGETIGRKYTHGPYMFRFECNCGRAVVALTARELRGQIRVHVNTDDHLSVHA
jgi:hypothetical protein